MNPTVEREFERVSGETPFKIKKSGAAEPGTSSMMYSSMPSDISYRNPILEQSNLVVTEKTLNTLPNE